MAHRAGPPHFVEDRTARLLRPPGHLSIEARIEGWHVETACRANGAALVPGRQAVQEGQGAQELHQAGTIGPPL